VTNGTGKPGTAGVVSSADRLPRFTPEQRERYRADLLETYFARCDQAYLSSAVGLKEVDAHVDGRYLSTVKWIMPWLLGCVEFQSETVLEIGCGTGSSTAAVAPLCNRVEAYDIRGDSIEAARHRLGLHGLHNASFHHLKAEQVLPQIRERHVAGSVGVVLLFAVLEHMTLAERLDTIAVCWELLRPGGWLVVDETPNRLVYSDGHTSLLPFFSQLPDELALLYASRSPRADFARSIEKARQESHARAMLRLARWGRGLSFHEFELAIGSLDGLIVADGYDAPMDRAYPVQADELLLLQWIAENAPTVHPAFTRRNLDLVLRKPGGSEERERSNRQRTATDVLRALGAF
jgi:S-adenosylmethionine-dependent methyltransferase